MKWTGLRKALARLKLMRKTEAVAGEIQARIDDHVNARCSVQPAQRPVDIADRSTHEWEPSYEEYIVSRLGDRCGDCGDEVEIGETVWSNEYEGNVTICRACYEVR